MEIILLQVIPSLIVSALLILGFSAAKARLMMLSHRLSRREEA